MIKVIKKKHLKEKNKLIFFSKNKKEINNYFLYNFAKLKKDLKNFNCSGYARFQHKIIFWHQID